MYTQVTQAKNLKPITAYCFEGYSNDLSKRLQENPVDLEDLHLLKGIMLARSESLDESLALIADDELRLQRISFGLKSLQKKIEVVDLFISYAEARSNRINNEDQIEQLKKEIQDLKNKLSVSESRIDVDIEVFFMQAAKDFLPEDLYRKVLEAAEEELKKCLPSR